MSGVCRTCRFFVEAIPLHLPAANIAADKVFAVAEEHPVADRVNVRRREVADASIACVFAVVGLGRADKLLPNLRKHPNQRLATSCPGSARCSTLMRIGESLIWVRVCMG